MQSLHKFLPSLGNSQKKFILRFIDLLGEHAVQGGHLGLDDYEGDDAADGQLENQHYPVMARKKDVMTF